MRTASHWKIRVACAVCTRKISVSKRSSLVVSGKSAMSARSALLPDLSALSLTSRNPDELPTELWEQILIYEPEALMRVPTSRSDYMTLAMIAVEQLGSYALAYVPQDRDDYGKIARHAVEAEPHRLDLVPIDRDDYFEIAMLAIRKSSEVIQHVSPRYARYAELAQLAEDVADCERCERELGYKYD